MSRCCSDRAPLCNSGTLGQTDWHRTTRDDTHVMYECVDVTWHWAHLVPSDLLSVVDMSKLLKSCICLLAGKLKAIGHVCKKFFNTRYQLANRFFTALGNKLVCRVCSHTPLHDDRTMNTPNLPRRSSPRAWSKTTPRLHIWRYIRE